MRRAWRWRWRRRGRIAAAAAARFRDLVDALSLRHPGPAPQDIDEEAYAERMRALAARRRGDADIAVLAAESLLNLHPYDWWEATGRALPWTGEIVSLLSRALTLAPAHPGANHYWVHLFETSRHARSARHAEADRLRTLVPGSGHLLHMPAHIDMRTGRYAEASAANERSIEADRRYLEQVDAQGAYRVGYVAHNHHFLWASAAMQGRSQVAIAATQAAWPAACGPRPGDLGSGALQHYAVLPLARAGALRPLAGTADADAPAGRRRRLSAGDVAVRARHGLAAHRPPARGARDALAQLLAVAADPGLQTTKVKNVNPAPSWCASPRSRCRRTWRRPRAGTPPPWTLLQQAVAVEDALAHDEPHLWLAPTRHALGAALLDAGRAGEAERVYLQDLRHYPDNGWSLVGFARPSSGKAAATRRAARARFRPAWRDADVPLTRSRF